MKKNIACNLLLYAHGRCRPCTTYAIVDSKYILEKMPDYKDAQKKLDQFSEQWQKEIDAKAGHPGQDV